jgi:hypothetical protein
VHWASCHAPVPWINWVIFLLFSYCAWNVKMGEYNCSLRPGVHFPSQLQQNSIIVLIHRFEGCADKVDWFYSMCRFQRFWQARGPRCYDIYRSVG